MRSRSKGRTSRNENSSSPKTVSSAGVTNNIEVTTAQDELARAQENYILAVSSYVDAKFALARAAGGTEKNIDQYLGKSVVTDRGIGRQASPQRSEAMKRRIPILIVVAALIAAGVYFFPRFTKPSMPPNELVLSGNIEAHESLVSFKVQGRVIELPVEEGQSVEAGVLLARLDDADYKQRVRIDEAGVRVRESDLALTPGRHA